jgi:hypothetical protein
MFRLTPSSGQDKKSLTITNTVQLLKINSSLHGIPLRYKWYIHVLEIIKLVKSYNIIEIIFYRIVCYLSLSIYVLVMSKQWYITEEDLQADTIWIFSCLIVMVMYVYVYI